MVDNSKPRFFKDRRRKKGAPKVPYTVVFKAGDFQSYLYDIIHEWLQVMVPITFTLVPLFFILDYFTMPSELLPRFGIYRLLATLFLIVQYYVIRRSKSSRLSYLHTYLLSFVIGGMIARMTVDLGGFDSRYWAGLNLVIVGANLLMPWKATYGGLNSGIIIGLYLILNFISGQSFDPSILVNNLFFLCSLTVIVVAINHVRHRLVEKEFYLLEELQKARDALWAEMELAKRIQTALLPDSEKIEGFEIAATMFTAKEVGGDYYDIIETPTGGKWVTIGDVSGHGVDSGLVMMMAETSIASTVNTLSDASPSKVIDSVNTVIRENISRLGSDHYMTLMALRIDDAQITVAGKHQDLIIYRASSNKTEVVSTDGTWLGITDHMGKFLKDKILNFEPGDTLLLFTDGLTEAMDKSGELYGQNRLEQAFNRYADLPVGKLLDKIIQEVQLFQEDQLDDMTLVVMKKLPD
ncbi:MAG: PP2C family protein-serine/threonine phosphatase [Fidelibacterota bacterium]|nr:MAG: PP2C family protein-serine/threonine phosphatase [Candidatus Neomarinimicrobiota bacterium]